MWVSQCIVFVLSDKKTCIKDHLSSQEELISSVMASEIWKMDVLWQCDEAVLKKDAEAM